MNRTTWIRLLAPALAWLAITATGPADEIVLKKGKRQGVVVKTEGGLAYINPYNSRNPRMTHGVETMPADRIKRVVPDPSPAAEYLRQLNLRRPPGKATTAADEFALGELAARLKFKDVARAHFLNALCLDPNRADARKQFDTYALERLQKADPRTNPELARALQDWHGLKTLAERRAELARLKSAYGFDRSLLFMERVRRNASPARGRREDIVLTLESKANKGVYTLFVPRNYDPMRSWPLVLGLHGGGADGKDGKDVVGTGRGAMNFYESGAARYGYLVVCPSAVRAPWHDRMNDPFVNAVLDEVCLLFNIDLNRIYLTGHSMGGYGTWHFGPRYAHRWAVIAPMAGGGHNGLNTLRKTLTPVYIYHGANDNVVGCSDSRRAADSLKKAGDDFVYTEIPDSGHGFPRDVAEEMWTFFHHRRLAVTPKRTNKGKFKVALMPCSSFEQPVTRSERLYFGAPGEETEDDVKTLLARMKLGGGAADEAGQALATRKDPTTVKPLAALATSRKLGEDVRGAAIRALGQMGFPDASKPLQKALQSAPLDLVPDAADALARLQDPGSFKALVRALARTEKEFENRLLGSTFMAYSDWDRCLAAFAALARAMGALKNPAGFKPLEGLIEKILLKDWKPRESSRAGLDPSRPLARCVIDVIHALAALGDARSGSLVDRLDRKHGKLPGVGEAAASARGGAGVQGAGAK